MSTDAAHKVINSVKDVLEDEEVSIGKIADSVGYHGNFTFVLVPAVPVTTPLSGIPGLSTLTGLLIAISSAQILVGRTSIWLPQWMRKLEVSRDQMRRALTYLDRTAHFISRVTKRRLEPLVGRLARRLIAGLCLICGGAMPLLEFVPFTSSVSGAFVSLLSIGVITRDGLMVVIALAPLAATVYLVFF